jgi:hypothetical protein
MPGGGWSQAGIASDLNSDVAFAVRANGEADIAMLSTYRALHWLHAFPGGAWQEDTIATGPFWSAPALFVRSSGEADVVVVGVDQSLNYFWAVPGSAWGSKTLPAKAYSNPSIFVRSTGEVDVVAMGAPGSILSGGGGGCTYGVTGCACYPDGSCNTGGICVYGSCLPCGGREQQCCTTGSACQTGLSCQFLAGTTNSYMCL